MANVFLIENLASKGIHLAEKSSYWVTMLFDREWGQCKACR